MSDTTQALEERIAHLQHTVDELSDIVARQDHELLTLARKVEVLIRREAERQADDPGSAIFTGDRPPHY
ncbi:SlyX family protein [Sagittula sp. SSi028]|uniref:SlyX family protein n=1 Tax=Sagittula sp. SSi028 TaxID=3400636 RepID=UPI003AF8E4EF